MAKSNKRELLMLSHPIKEGTSPIGLFLSEKLDGVRAFWDGGVTRGMPTREVPWAGLLHPKTKEPKKKVYSTSTGLWSRYGNPIVAPPQWLDTLPPIFLDGELYLGPGRFQETVSIVTKEVPEVARWEEVRYCVFGSPSIAQFCRTGQIGNQQQFTYIDGPKCEEFLRSALSFWQPVHGSLRNLETEERIYCSEHLEEWIDEPQWNYTDVNFIVKFSALANPVQFRKEQAFLKSFIRKSSKAYLLSQKEITSQELLDSFYETVLEKGGEGVMLRDPKLPWEPKRNRVVQKLKPFTDSEATIVGFKAGRDAFEGMIGALVVDWGGQVFDIGSGLKVHEREIYNHAGGAEPGQQLPEKASGRHFKVGDVVTFKFCGLTDEGVPRIASYWRKHEKA